VTAAVNHESCVSSKSNNKKQYQQPDYEIRTLRMTTIAAKWTIFAYFIAARFAVFKKRFIHFSSLLILLFI
jgi:hypothetical protein